MPHVFPFSMPTHLLLIQPLVLSSIAVSNVRPKWRDALNRRACRRGLVNKANRKLRESRVPRFVRLDVGNDGAKGDTSTADV